MTRLGLLVMQEIGLYEGRIASLVVLFLLAGFVIFYLRWSRTHKVFIRKVAGIDAIDEAIGRATEMGRPVSYIPGIGGISYLSTMCSLSILGEVAKKCAELESDLVVMNRQIIVQQATAGIVRDAYRVSGKPEKFSEDMVRYIAPNQFAFSAGVLGFYKRDKPAANLLFGRFWAESLQLCEVGYQVGAMQIAGSDAMAQLPFLVAATDYCLIGEELYAAAAYIGRDPVLTGSIAGQDWGKILALTLLILGIIMAWVVPKSTWLVDILNI